MKANTRLIAARGVPFAAAATLLLAIAAANPASAQVSFNISFNDPGGTYSSYYADITSNLGAAENLWGQSLSGSTTFDVVVSFDENINRSFGHSVVSSFVENTGGYDIYEQGAAAKLRTGVDPNAASPDISIGLNPTYMTSELWFDPSPASRTTAVPSDRTDAVSVFLHELGHAFAFNGWRDGSGNLPGNYMSTFDQHISEVGGDLYYSGTAAEGSYGGPVPITWGNPNHIGNQTPRPGSDLIPDLMNGIVFNRGTRYDISGLDLAIAQDAGLAVVPEPRSAIAAGALCFAAAISFRARSKRQSK
jgi:hypothetical protein